VTATTKNLVEFRGDEPSLAGNSNWMLAQMVAESSAFSRATQLRAILLYIVRQSILHPDEPIHEADIAHRVLGRRSDFNPLDDNIVRVQVAHLRKKLDLYFSTEGRNEEMVIAIALGSYRPIFSARSEPVTSPLPFHDPKNGALESSVIAGEGVTVASGSEPDPAALVGIQTASRRSWMRPGPILAALIILLLGGCCLTLWLQNRAMQRSFYAWKYSPAVASFWNEFLSGKRDTDVVMSDAFFKLAQDMTKKPFTLDDYISRSYVHELMSQEKNPDALLVIGKVSAWSSANPNHLKLARRILALDPLGQSTHLYYAREYRPDLIEQDNVILLGSRITNPWAYLFDSRLNFAVTPDSNDFTTITNRAPAPGEQKVYTRTDSSGYCVVAYLPNPTSNNKVLLIEGTSVEATEAGGDFLLSEDRLSSFQKTLHVTQFPYFEVLLKTSQVKGTPLTATVEAYRTYPVQP